MRPALLQVILLAVSFAFAACTPSATRTPTPDARATETKIAANIFATQTASVPTATRTPESTPTNTPIPTPTDTPRPTNTPTITPTPTNTSTPTITPTPTQTLTPSPIPSPTPTFDVGADKKTYQAIDVRELKKAPDSYRGQKIAVAGEVFRITETSAGTEMQIWISYPGATSFDRVAVYVKYSGRLPGLYEKDDVLVYGQAAGTSEGVNAFGGVVSQPLINAKYADYGKTLPTVPPIAKNVVTNMEGKWEITYVGDFRDKIIFSIFGGDSNKTAMGIWATVQFRVRNLQAGSDSFGRHYDMVAIDENGAIYKDDLGATVNATWQYCGCETINKQLGPGQDTVFVISFDVPESTKTLIIAPTMDVLSSKPIASPRFLIANFDQIPAWKPKK